MPPKHKNFLKPNTKAKSKEPQSENDFLEAADEFEQSAGKWRAGDAVKATRFFNRAINMYNTGLQRYPNSFDLAYNKANLEYNICEDDRIVAMLGSKVDLLEEALRSHRTATALNTENTDVRFNTGQVLTSLAEALLKSETQDMAKVPAQTLLEEAVDIFTTCLARQQQEYEQIQIEIAKANASQDYDGAANIDQGTNADTPGSESMETASSSDAPGEWATVVEPVTPEVILETCIAQLEALTTLLSLHDPSDLSNVEVKAQSGLDTVNTKIPTLINLIAESPFAKAVEDPASGPTLFIGSSATIEEAKPTTKDEALLATANFQASIAEATYRSGQGTIVLYGNLVEQIFAPLTQDHPHRKKIDSGYVNALSSYADALIDLASAIADSPRYTISSPSSVDNYEAQWTALTKAQTILTRLSTAPYTSALSSSRLADIFVARGDVDLFRLRIALSDLAKPAWVKSKAVLVSNAGVFYRGARSYADKAGAVEVQKTADAKVVVAEILKEAVSGSNVKKEHWKGKGPKMLRVLEQMVEEGIITKENAEGVVRCV